MTDPAIRARQIAEAHAGMDGPLLPVLHAIQSELGHIPPDVFPEIAAALDLSTAEVHGVVSYYPDFRTTPPGRRILRVCRAEACQAMGGAALADALRAGLGLDWHETRADGAVTLEPAYCLGLCACAPAALVDGAPRGRVTADTLLAEVAP
ncbi:formate dehydrogenase subunit gamma [Rhodovulum adriaticum]|uniref:Formate dehydrogenase gamma subunit n=1 Tax=Rhodovulum adriaticum TaxID=35804 RepID=A0A4V2SM02_RHOAD|nr:formate dehydrogenase subunit gamma [Rhodovulum adriaticum]MBK1635977.1 formate dehydrogenase subunit gamma [Rhodovulum adriaticum]TCP25436.1 formate dehydrogenase gamma subunit [Rhodovulum adriaticum]